MFYNQNENYILSLRSSTFTMNVSLPDFFPTSKKNVINLLKNNVMECENVSNNLKQILSFLENAKNDYSGFNGSYIAMNKLKEKYNKNIKYVNDFILKNGGIE